MRNMSKNILSAALVAALAAAPFAQAAAQDATAQDSSGYQQTVPGKANDAWITTKVKSELATTDQVHARDINVDTSDGHVSLTGTVGSQQLKDTAQRVAQQVTGVKSVDTSGLMVSASSETAAAGHEMDDNDMDDHDSGMAMSQDQGDNQTVPGKANDAWITSKVKSQFAMTSDVPAHDINVDTRDGNVTLTGTVDNEQAAEKARQVALSVKGVRSVDTTNLRTGMASTAQTGDSGYANANGNMDNDNQTALGKTNDAWITTKVKSSLAASDNVDANSINVDTSNGQVRLSGTVANTQARDAARQVAQNIEGVKSVDVSGLNVSQRTADTDSGL